MHIGNINIHVGSEYKRNLMYNLIDVTKLDVCVITETWIKEGRGEEFNKVIENEIFVWYSRERKEQKRRNGEGGVGILIKKNVGKSQIIKSSKKFDTLWIKVEREDSKLLFFIAAVYISPEGSARGKEGIEQLAELEVDIMEFSKQGYVIIMGDFNARIGNLESSYVRNRKRAFLSRQSEDHSPQGVAAERGKQLIETMNACNMVIINGIDQVCPYTFQNVNLKSKSKNNKKEKEGFSTIDYIVISENSISTNQEERKEEKQNLKYVNNSFKVWNENFADISDHKLIS